MLWIDVWPVSTQYHAGGSVLIVAKSPKAARDLWAKYAEKRGIPLEDADGTVALAEEPDRTWVVSPSRKAEVLVFEDSGCC